MRALSTLIWACGLSSVLTSELDQGGISLQTRRQIIQTAEQTVLGPVTKCVLDDLANTAALEQWNTTEAGISQKLREALSEGLQVGLDLPLLLAMDPSRAESWVSISSRKEGPSVAVPNKSRLSSEHYGHETAVLPLRIMASVSVITALAIWSMSQGSVSGLKACTLLVCLLYFQQRQVVGW